MKEDESYSDNDNDSKKEAQIVPLNKKNNIINGNNNLINNKESENKKKEENIINELYNENINENENENIDNKEPIKIVKIICLECDEIPTLEIDHDCYKIKSVCPNGHIIQESLISFIQKSNEKLLQIQNIECSVCKKKMNELDNKENDMYKCNCGKYICESCKENHEKIEEENMGHNLVEYKEKDFKCTCSESLEDFIYFCNNCHKNLCSICEAEHPRDHNIYDYSNEILSEKEIEQKKQKYEQQKNNIKDFLTKLDNLKKRLEDNIGKLKKTLDAHLAINNYIITKFDRCATNKQMIENIKKIDFNLSEFINNFRNTKHDKEPLQ